MTNTKKTRLNLDVYPEKLEEIKRLVDASGVSTQKEFFENALTLTKWMIRQKKAGKSIGALSNENRFTELEMPFLENARNSSIDI